MERGMFMNKRKVIALVLVAAIVFGFWNGPISSKADKKNNKANEQVKNETEEKIEIPEDEVVDSFTVDAEDGDYFEYKITETDVYCIYYKYVGEDKNGNKQYEESITKIAILSNLMNNELLNNDTVNEDPEVAVTESEEVDSNDDVSEEEIVSIMNSPMYRNESAEVKEEKEDKGNPLYWQKITRDKLKKEYYYQSGVKGEDIYYRIGGNQSFAINYSKLSEQGKADVDAFIDQLNLVNKELTECLICAIGAVMVAISAIIASYVSVGAAKCLGIIAPLLQKFGVTLLSITPVGFGKLVFKTYDDYLYLEPVFLQAATYGSIFTW